MDSVALEGPVAWKSRRQATTALSTTEAECMTCAHAARQAVWLRLLLEHLEEGLSHALPILNNSKAATLLKNPVHYYDRFKLIDIHYHFLWD